MPGAGRRSCSCCPSTPSTTRWRRDGPTGSGCAPTAKHRQVEGFFPRATDAIAGSEGARPRGPFPRAIGPASDRIRADACTLRIGCGRREVGRRRGARVRGDRRRRGERRTATAAMAPDRAGVHGQRRSLARRRSAVGVRHAGDPGADLPGPHLAFPGRHQRGAADPVHHQGRRFRLSGRGRLDRGRRGGAGAGPPVARGRGIDQSAGAQQRRGPVHGESGYGAGLSVEPGRPPAVRRLRDRRATLHARPDPRQQRPGLEHHGARRPGLAHERQ